MQDVLIGFIHWVNNMLQGIPTFQFGYLNKIQDGIDWFYELLGTASWILPVKDIAIIWACWVSFRMFKMGLFFKNWVIKRVRG